MGKVVPSPRPPRPEGTRPFPPLPIRPPTSTRCWRSAMRWPMTGWVAQCTTIEQERRGAAVGPGPPTVAPSAESGPARRLPAEVLAQVHAALAQEKGQHPWIRSIAVPPLGCGNGGLDWADVRPLIEEAFADLVNVQVLLFAPEGAPAVETMRVAQSKKSCLSCINCLAIYYRFWKSRSWPIFSR